MTEHSLNLDRKAGRPCPTCGQIVGTVGGYLSHLTANPACMDGALARVDVVRKERPADIDPDPPEDC